MVMISVIFDFIGSVGCDISESFFWMMESY